MSDFKFNLQYILGACLLNSRFFFFAFRLKFLIRVFISGEDLGGVVSCFTVQQHLSLVTDSFFFLKPPFPKCDHKQMTRNHIVIKGADMEF